MALLFQICCKQDVGGEWPGRRASVIKTPHCKHNSFQIQLSKSLWDSNSHSFSPLIGNGYSVLDSSPGDGSREGEREWQTGKFCVSQGLQIWLLQAGDPLFWHSFCQGPGNMGEVGVVFLVRQGGAEPWTRREHCGFCNPMMQWLYQLTGVLSRCFLLIDKELRLVFDR